MGCSASKGVVKQIVSSNSTLKKPFLFIRADKLSDSGRGSSANTELTSAASGQSSRPPFRVPKLGRENSKQMQPNEAINNVVTTSRGVAYELNIDLDRSGADGASIVKSHPPKGLRRLEMSNGKTSYDKLMQDLHEAEERKAKLMKERKEQCQTRRETRNGQERRISLESKDQPRMIVTNVEIVHGNF